MVRRASPSSNTAPLLARRSPWRKFAPDLSMLAPRGRLLKSCYVMQEQARALDRKRFSDTLIAILTQEEMSQVERLFFATCGMAQYLTQ